MIVDEEDYLAHYGVLRRSGRYPYGSGGHAEVAARSITLLSAIDKLKAEGFKEPEIAKALFGENGTTTQLRAQKTIANNAKKHHDILTAEKLKKAGLSNVAIGKEMGINESSVRALLAPGAKLKADSLITISDALRAEVDKKGVIDVGSGVEASLHISTEKLKTAIAILKEEGYDSFPVQSPQLGTSPGQKTTTRVLVKPGTTYRDVVSDLSQVKPFGIWSEDNGLSVLGISDPLSVSSKRLAINYDEDGGGALDGVMYIRPGVSDLSMGKSSYAQVRIAVDRSHYLKGMAIYKDDLPDGVDIVFNTNKSNTGNKLDALKAMKDDPDNPFGSAVRQIYKQNPDGSYVLNSDGKRVVSSALNIVNEEGDWSNWRRAISTQVLSKQAPTLAKEQLDLTYEKRKAEYDTIMSLTNPTVKRKLLEAFAESTDTAAVEMAATALPRQTNKVILPVNSLKPSEVYAPGYKNGETVALIRYPHGGTFEIPELTVNNSNREARSSLGLDPLDAIGIHSSVASKLSGADFDGDTVLVIPNDSGKIKTSPSLEGLKNFDPQKEYRGYEGMPKMSSDQKQFQMGNVSNLITDMTINKAPTSEIVRAVRHSMVVIDAEKHGLDWKQSAIDNGISSLKEKYQGGANAGASTLISKATSEYRVEDRRLRRASEGGPIDPKTGELVYVPTGKGYTKTVVNKRTGETREVFVPKTLPSTKLREAKDASDLSSGTPIEKIYADHSNKLKALANLARKETLTLDDVPYNPSAAKTYDKEVQELSFALNKAKQNRPRERQAQIAANTVVSLRLKQNPHMDKAERKKLEAKALQEQRNRFSAKKETIIPTPRQWAAIQSGAIRKTRLKEILNNSDLEKIKELALPKAKPVVSSAMQTRAKSMLRNGYTQAEVAAALGIPLGTLKDSVYS